MIGMAIIYVDVTGEILAVDGTPAVGTVIFQIPQELRDVVDNVVLGPGTFTAVLDLLGQFTVTLPATDSPDVSPSGWLYRVHVHTDVWAESFSTSLPAAFAPTAEFADLIPTQSEPCTPDGTPCATLAQIADLQQQIDAISAGGVTSVNGETGVVIIDAADVGADPAGSAAQALIDANAYTDAEIAALPPDAVTSVNGQVGVVVLDAGDVGADPAGSAATALASANTYTDGQISTLDGLVLHKAGAENVTGVKTFLTNPVFNAAGIPQAAVANLVADLAAKIPNSLVDAKADLLTATANDVPARLAVGSDGHVVYANPATTTGLEWRSADPDALTAGMTTLYRHVMGQNTNVALGAASGNLRLAYFTAPRAEVWTQVGWVGGTVAAAATPSLVRWGLYTVASNGDLTLVASTPNDTALFAVASAVGAKSFSVAYAAVAGQRYAIGVLVVSGVAIPSIQGVSLNQATVQASLSPRITGVIPAQADLPLSALAGTVNASNAAFGAQILP